MNLPTEHQPLEFQPLEFSKTLHGELRPPLYDGDHTRGNDYARGELQSLHYAKNALMLTVGFTPGSDAESVGWKSQSGKVEFLLVKRQGRYLGTVISQIPGNSLWFSTGEKVSILDGLGHDGPGLGGRQAAHFWCTLRLPEMSDSVAATVSVFIGRSWFGRWKEVVVKLPKKELYVARL